jgi:hypothetical protein
MKSNLSLLLSLLWALTIEARGVDEKSSRVRGAARKLNHVVRNSPNASVEKKSNKKASEDTVDDGSDSDGDDSDGGQLSLLPRWFDLLRPCKLLEDQFRGSINCETMLLIPLLIERQVKVEIYTDELCDPLTRRICTTPGFEVIVDFDDQYLTKNVFFADISIGPINVGTLNFGIDVCLDEEEEPVNQSNATSAFAESASLCGCEVSLADYPCNSCEFCENGGVSFDCSNIVVGLTNNGSCDTLPRPQSVLGDSEKIDVSFPDFLLNMKL